MWPSAMFVGVYVKYITGELLYVAISENKENWEKIRKIGIACEEKTEKTLAHTHTLVVYSHMHCLRHVKSALLVFFFMMHFFFACPVPWKFLIKKKNGRKLVRRATPPHPRDFVCWQEPLYSTAYWYNNPYWMTPGTVPPCFVCLCVGSVW